MQKKFDKINKNEMNVRVIGHGEGNSMNVGIIKYSVCKFRVFIWYIIS